MFWLPKCLLLGFESKLRCYSISGVRRQYNKEHHEKYSETSNKTSHKVIRQEFDGVAVTLDHFFSYDENGNLIYKSGVYYDPPKMLFQSISRCRKRLNLVIIGNAELLSRCIAILQQPGA